MKKSIYIIVLFIGCLLSAQSDCITAIPVCGNSSISYNPSSAGTIMEPTNPSCLADEHFSVWYTFTIATSGTLTFVINPNTVPNVTHYDYDFALYGPNFNCTTGNYGTPIRCNFSGTSGPTGLGNGATDPNGYSNPPGVGSQWSSELTVQAGETYVLLIDNYIPSNPYGFVLNWGGTATLTSPFNPTIQPNPFIPPTANQLLICTSPQLFDFTTLSAGILNGNANFNINYYTSSNNAITGTSPITTPINVTTGTTYYYAITYTDPTNPTNPLNACKEYGTFTFTSGSIVVNPATVTACNNNNSGTGTFNLTSASAAIFNDPTATIAFYTTAANAAAGTNPIANPTAYVSAEGQVYAGVTTVQGCKNTAVVTLSFLPLLPVTPATITACNNNNAGVAYFDLTTANVYSNTNAPKKYFPTLNDLLNGTNQIANPQLYLSAQGQVFVEVTGTDGCKNYTKITLNFHPAIPTNEATLTECFLVIDPTKGEFDLTTANVSTLATTTKQYYKTMQDAINDTNMITNPFVYISTSTAVYARVIGPNLCWNIAKINLKVTPPTYSSVLTDKIICIEDRTTLDAGPGFTSYQWSTGATTQSITNVQVGEYWVDLGKDGCITRQTVKVKATTQPVITSLDVSFTSITVGVSGGTAPYKYSLDGVTWQDSNVLTNVPRGQAFVYVKDNFDCDPVIVEITVPNLVNAITPNDDNVNDYLDYSALHYKKNLTINIFNRYGNKIYEGNNKNLYRWDGRSGGKKVVTGTYWYTITWNEPDTGSPVKYSGWIMVKNRE